MNLKRRSSLEKEYSIENNYNIIKKSMQVVVYKSLTFVVSGK